MADAPETPATEPEVPVADAPQEQPEVPQTTDEQTETTSPAAEETPESPALPAGIEQDEDGQLVFRSGDSVYKGKDQNELWSNVSKGITEKDQFIATLKAEKSVNAPETKPVAPPADDEVIEPPPDEKAILEKHIQQAVKRHGIDPARLSWTREQWGQYADESGKRDLIVAEELAEVKAAKAEIERGVSLEASESTQTYINKLTVKQERKQVERILAKSGVDAAKFDYKAIEARVLADPNAKDPATGLLLSGYIVAEASQAIMELAVGKRMSTFEKTKLEDIAKGTKAKGSVRTPVASATTYKPPEKQYASFSDVTQDVTSSRK